MSRVRDMLLTAAEIARDYPGLTDDELDTLVYLAMYAVVLVGKTPRGAAAEARVWERLRYMCRLAAFQRAEVETETDAKGQPS